MGTKPIQQKSEGSGGPVLGEFFELGREGTDAMLGMQRELLDAYEHASRAWLARVQREANLWSELAGKLMSSSVPKALSACQEDMARRMQMATEDGRQLAEDAQKVMEAMVQSVTTARQPLK